MPDTITTNDDLAKAVKERDEFRQAFIDANNRAFLAESQAERLRDDFDRALDQLTTEQAKNANLREEGLRLLEQLDKLTPDPGPQTPDPDGEAAGIPYLVTPQMVPMYAARRRVAQAIAVAGMVAILLVAGLVYVVISGGGQ